MVKRVKETKNNQDWCLDGEKIVAKNITVLGNDSHIKLYKKVG